MVKKMQDEKIIELFFNRSEDAISETDKLYGKRIENFAYNILRNIQDAEECKSDTYLRLWYAIPPQKPTRFFAFILRICRNIALDKIDWYNAKKRKLPVCELTDELGETVADIKSESSFDSGIIQSAINSFLEELSEENRFIFVRRYFYMDQIKAIASYTGMNPSTIKTRLHRMREKLRTHLKTEGIII